MREASAGGGFQRILLGHSAHSPLKSLRNFQYAQAAIGHVHQVDAGHHPEQLAGYMASTPNAGGSHVDLAGIGLGESNEFRNGLDGCTTMRLGSYIALQRQVRDKLTEQLASQGHLALGGSRRQVIGPIRGRPGQPCR